MCKIIPYKLLYSLKNLLIDAIKKIQKIPRKLYVWRVLSTRNRWYLSRNHNLYNPTIQATIYPWKDSWNIARFGIHYENYPSKVVAKLPLECG